MFKYYISIFGAWWGWWCYFDILLMFLIAKVCLLCACKTILAKCGHADLCRLTDKPISFEISLGNAGNSLDGQLQTMATQNEDGKNTVAIVPTAAA